MMHNTPSIDNNTSNRVDALPRVDQSGQIYRAMETADPYDNNV